MDGASSDVYLGMPFLQQHSAILTFRNNEKHTLSLLIGVPVLADTHLELAPYMDTVVPGFLQVWVPQSSLGCVYTCECSYAKGLTAAHAAVTAHHSTVPARL